MILAGLIYVSFTYFLVLDGTGKVGEYYKENYEKHERSLKSKGVI